MSEEITNKAEAATALTDAETLAVIADGREPITLTFADDTTAAATIKKVPARQMSELLAHQADDARCIGLFVEGELKEGWIDQLCDESYMEVLERGWEINGPLFEKYYRLQKAKLKRLGVDVEANMEKALREAEQPEALASAAWSPS